MIASSTTTTQLQRYLSEHPNLVALLPFGSLEQHGPHLPLGTDTLIAESISRLVESSHPNDVYLLPALHLGLADEHRGFAGTISLTAPTILSLLTETFEWLSDSGFKRIILYNAHGGNQDISRVACTTFSHRSTTKAKYVYAFSPSTQKEAQTIFGTKISHAGSTESSLLASLVPELNLTQGKIPNHHPYHGGGYLDRQLTKEIVPTGVLELSDTITIDAVKGKSLADILVSDLINHLKSPWEYTSNQ